MLGITSGPPPSIRCQRVWMLRRKVTYSGEWSAAMGPSPASSGAIISQPDAFAPSVSRAMRSGCSGLGRMTPLAMKCCGSCCHWRSSKMAFICPLPSVCQTLPVAGASVSRGPAAQSRDARRTGARRCCGRIPPASSTPRAIAPRPGAHWSGPASLRGAVWRTPVACRALPGSCLLRVLAMASRRPRPAHKPSHRAGKPDTGPRVSTSGQRTAPGPCMEFP